METSFAFLPPVCSVVYKAVKKDRANRYGLVYAVSYGRVTTKRFPAFDFDNGTLFFQKVSEDSFNMTIKPFTPDSGYWDGTTFLPDGGTKDLDALLRASVAHDVIYQFAEQLAKAGNTDVKNIFAFADDCLKVIADANGCSSKLSRVLHGFLRTFGPLYHKAVKLLTLASLTVCPACVNENPLDFTKIEIPNPPIVWEINGKTNSWNIAESTTNTVETVVEEPVSTNIVEVVDEPVIEEPAFAYKSFGSPDCSKCKEDPDVQIKDLKMNRNGLSYHWAKGNLRNWGVTDDHDHNHALVIAGYLDGNTWRFAKFDWVSTDRLTRSFENIKNHYNGFNPDAFFNAPERGFFIMSADGKKRTNILFTK